MAALTIFRGWAHAEPSTPVTQRSPCLWFFLNLIKYLFRLGATPLIPTATATARVPGHPDLGRAAQRDPSSFCRTTKTTTTVATSAQRNQKNAPGWVYRMRIKNPESTFKAYNFWLAKDIEKLQTSLKSYRHRWKATWFSFPKMSVAFLYPCLKWINIWAIII